jgi:hypothetical protein
MRDRELLTIDAPAVVKEMGERMPALLDRSHGKRIQDYNTYGGSMASRGTSAGELRVDMTGGKASDAKTADGDAPVFAYIASLPQPQRGIAEQIDALAAKTLPGLRRGVKWGMAYYGVEGGWCFTSGAFVGDVKVMFIYGTDLEPEPPVKPIAMGKPTRGVEIASIDDLDEVQLADWMRQAAEKPFVTAQERRKAGVA